MPDDLSLQFYSGVWPADPLNYNVSNKYFLISATENATKNYDIDLDVKYDEPYLETIGDEATPGLGLAADTEAGKI